MSGRGSKRDGSEDGTLGEPEKKRMCQEAARGQQGKITQAEDEKKRMCQKAARGQQGNTTPWDPLRQDVCRSWPGCGKGLCVLIGVLEKHMQDKCDDVHSEITAGNHERLQQARHKAREMMVDACSQFFAHVPDNSGLVMPPLPLGVDEQYRATQGVQFQCKIVIKNMVLILPKFEDNDIVQVVRALGRLLVR